MLKHILVVLLSLIILDVPSMPFGCGGGGGYSSDRGDLYIIFESVDHKTTNEKIKFRRNAPGTYHEGDIISSDIIQMIINGYMIDSGIEDEYRIKDVYMLQTNHSKGEKITLPYAITDENIIPYYQGIRNAFFIFVEIEKAHE